MPVRNTHTKTGPHLRTPSLASHRKRRRLSRPEKGEALWHTFLLHHSCAHLNTSPELRSDPVYILRHSASWFQFDNTVVFSVHPTPTAPALNYLLNHPQRTLRGAYSRSCGLTSLIGDGPDLIIVCRPVLTGFRILAVVKPSKTAPYRKLENSQTTPCSESEPYRNFSGGESGGGGKWLLLSHARARRRE